MKLPEAPFSAYLDKQPTIDAAWTAVEERFALLPAPLRTHAQNFSSSITAVLGSHRLYFSTPLAPPLLYMPLWFLDGLRNEMTVPSPTDTRVVDILTGTILGYIGIRVQDDVLDEPGRTDPQMLLFGNTCFSGMIAAYARALPTSSRFFWTHFDRDFVDFSHFTLAERQTISQDEPYSRDLFEAHAEKVAFARTPLLAVAALVERPEVDPLIRKLVHQLGIAYGIVNDIVGWTRDLRAGQRTWLLASTGLTHEHLQEALASPARMTQVEERIRSALYEGHGIRDALRYSIEQQKLAAETALELRLEGFSRYTNERLEWLESLERQTSLITLSRVLGTSGA